MTQFLPNKYRCTPAPYHHVVHIIIKKLLSISSMFQSMYKSFEIEDNMIVY